MKKLQFIILFFLLIVFQKSNASYPVEIMVNHNALVITNNADSLPWIKQLKLFKTAIVSNDKATLKSFIDFPILEGSKDIWYWIEQQNEVRAEEISSEPFTEKDFDKYATKLFPKKFVNSFSKLNIELLAKKGESETIKFNIDHSTTYKMYATVDKEAETVTLALNFRKIEKDKKGRIESSEEYGTLYIFSIKNGRLKFVKIIMTA